MHASQQDQIQAQFKLRLPKDLRDWLQANGQKNHRNLTHEINFILASHRQNIENQQRTT